MEHQDLNDHLLNLHCPDPNLPPRMDVWPMSEIDLPPDVPFEQMTWNGDEHEGQLMPKESEECGLLLKDLKALLEDVEQDPDWGLDSLAPEECSLGAIGNGVASTWPLSNSPAQSSQRSLRFWNAIST